MGAACGKAKHFDDSPSKSLPTAQRYEARPQISYSQNAFFGVGSSRGKPVDTSKFLFKTEQNSGSGSYR